MARIQGALVSVSVALACALTLLPKRGIARSSERRDRNVQIRLWAGPSQLLWAGVDRLIISRQYGGREQYFSLPLDGIAKATELSGFEAAIAKYPRNVGAVLVSPDGRNVAWQSMLDGVRRLMECRVTGENIRTVDDGDYSKVLWSDDSSRLLCFQSRPGLLFSSVRVFDLASQTSFPDIPIAEEQYFLSGANDDSGVAGFPAISVSSTLFVRSVQVLGPVNNGLWQGAEWITAYSGPLGETRSMKSSRIKLPAGTTLGPVYYTHLNHNLLLLLVRNGSPEFWKCNPSDGSLRRLSAKFPKALKPGRDPLQFPQYSTETFLTPDDRYFVAQCGSTIFKIFLGDCI